MLWKQQLVQLYKPPDREPTEVTLEDRGISLIVRFAVTAYKAMSVPVGAGSVWS